MEFLWGVLATLVAVYVYRRFTGGDHHSKSELQGKVAAWEQKYYVLDLELNRLQKETKVLDSNHVARQQRLLGSIGAAAAQIDRVLTLFPAIEDVRSFTNRIAPEDLAKANLPWAQEFQTAMTQALADNFEAMTSLWHGMLKLAVGLEHLKATGATASPGVRFVAEVLVDVKDTIEEYAPMLDIPGFSDSLARILALTVQRLEASFQQGDAPPSPEAVARFREAIEELKTGMAHNASSAFPDGVRIIDNENVVHTNGKHANGQKVRGKTG